MSRPLQSDFRLRCSHGLALTKISNSRSPVQAPELTRHFMLLTASSLLQLSALPQDSPLVSLWSYSASTLLLTLPERPRSNAPL